MARDRDGHNFAGSAGRRRRGAALRASRRAWRHGAARLARLRTCLAALRRAGATLFVLSNGFEEEINSALKHVGLDRHFATVIGAEGQDALGTGSKPELLAKLAPA